MMTPDHTRRSGDAIVRAVRASERTQALLDASREIVARSQQLIATLRAQQSFRDAIAGA